MPREFLAKQARYRFITGVDFNPDEENEDDDKDNKEDVTEQFL